MNSQHIHRLSPCKLGSTGLAEKVESLLFSQVSPTCCSFPKGREPFGVALKDGVPPPPPPSVRGSLAHSPVSTGKYALHRNHTSKQVNRNLPHLERGETTVALSFPLPMFFLLYSSDSIFTAHGDVHCGTEIY